MNTNIKRLTDRGHGVKIVVLKGYIANAVRSLDPPDCGKRSYDGRRGTRHEGKSPNIRNQSLKLIGIIHASDDGASMEVAFSISF